MSITVRLCCMHIHEFYTMSLRAEPKYPSKIEPHPHYLYISSNGLVSAKQESHTSFTTLTACTSSLQLGLFITDLTARFLTHAWCCCVTVQLLRVKNSRVHLHSPLRLEALIYAAAKSVQIFVFLNIETENNCSPLYMQHASNPPNRP